MGPLNFVLWIAGVALIAIGYQRARGPWTRYQALKTQDENVARYEAWRGGVRNDPADQTGASVAMAILRRQAQIGGLIAIAGVVLVFVGFLIR
jgi:hypothetical protein